MADKLPPAARSGTFLLGGDLPVHRLGFGAMRITGKGSGARPRTATRRSGVLRAGHRARASTSSTPPIPTARRSASADRGGAAPRIPRTWSSPPRRGLTPRRARINGATDGRPEYLRAQSKEASRGSGSTHRPAAASPDRPARCRSRISSARSAAAAAKGRSATSACRKSPSSRSSAPGQSGRRSSPSRTATTSPTAKSEDVLDYCEARGHRVHPVVPARDRRSRPGRRPARPARRAARRHAVAGRAGLAAPPLAGDAADPGHVPGQAPGGEHRGRAARAGRGDPAGAGSPDRLTVPLPGTQQGPALAPGPAVVRSGFARACSNYRVRDDLDTFDSLMRSTSRSCWPVMRCQASRTASFTFSHAAPPADRCSNLSQPVRRSDSTSFQFRPIWCWPDSKP